MRKNLSFTVNKSTVNFNGDKFEIVAADGQKFGDWYSDDAEWTEKNLSILKRILENENWTEKQVSNFVDDFNEKNAIA